MTGTFIETLNSEEIDVLRKLLLTSELQYMIGGGDWDLSESEEFVLWDIIAKAKGA